MLIHVDDPITLQGARSTGRPLAVTYGMHSEYELSFVAGASNTPVDLQSFNCTSWSVTIAPSPDSPTAVLAYAVFQDDIAQGSTLKFDLAATSVEMYRFCCGNPATPAVMEIKGFAAGEATPAVSIRMAVTIATTMDRRKPTDLSTALMEEVQLQASIAGATQQQVARTLDEVRRISAGVDSEAASVADVVASAVDVRIQGYEAAAVSAASDAMAQANTATSAAAMASAAASAASLDAANASGHASDAADRSSQAFTYEQNASSAMRAAQAAAASASTDMGAVSSALESATSQAELASAYKESAHSDMAAASDAKVAASQAEQHASASESNASASESNASSSESNASVSEQHASASESNASVGERHASASESNASVSEQHASASESNASASESNASRSESNASASETNASASESNASVSEQHASTSEQHASASESKAAAGEQHASASEQHASASESNASVSERNASASESNASKSEASALSCRNAASVSEQHASASEQHASASEQHASASESGASASARLAESWTVGGTGVRDGEDTDNAKYYAELSSRYSPEGKADKVQGDAGGHLAALDSTGNLEDSGIPVSNAARQDGYYAKEGLGAKTAENFIDPNATPAEASFGFRTAAGDVSISDDSNGQFDSFQGVTHVVNQQVAPSSSKTATGDGSIEVTDGYAGNAESLVLAGDTYVRNQLVQDHVENTATGTGLVEVTDAVGGYAKGLVMKGDAYVKNQLVENGDFSDGNDGWSSLFVTRSISDNVLTMTVSTSSSSCSINRSVNVLSGHVYMVGLDVKSSVSNSINITATTGSNNPHVFMSGTATSTAWTRVSAISTPSVNVSTMTVRPFIESHAVGDSCDIRNIQLVDLTQLCNGNSTKIAAIQTWDDLAAQYPEYSSYVMYNPGEVVGVQPTVKATGKNLFDKTQTLTQGYLQSDGTIYTSQTTWRVTDYIPVPQGALITMSYPSNAGSSQDCIGFYDGGKNLISTQGHTYNAITLTFTAPTGCRYIRDSFRYADLNTYQIELGSMATSYEPYYDGGTMQASAPLFGIGTAKDSEEGIGGTRAQVVGSYTFTGNENWYGIDSNGRVYTDVIASLVYRPSNWSTSLVLPGYLPASSASSDMTCSIDNNGYLYIRNDTYSTKADMVASLVGKTVHYILASSVTSSVTPHTISLQAGDNVLLQTDGGRSAELDLVYDGTHQTIALDSTHRYVMNDNGQGGVSFTGETSIECVGGEDQLVDLTRLCSGTALSATASSTWDSLKARIPEYQSTVAYDTGTVVNSRPGVKLTGKNLLDDSIKSSNASYSFFGNNATHDGITLPAGTYTASIWLNGNVKSCPLYVRKAPEDSALVPYTLTGYATFTITQPTTVFLRIYPRVTENWADYKAQIEVGLTYSTYEPYHDGGSAQASADLVSLANVADTEDAVKGERTTRIGSYTFTGNETWTLSDNWYTEALASTAKFASNVYCVSDKLLGMPSAGTSSAYGTPDSCWLSNNTAYKRLYVNKSDITDAGEMAAFMAGSTIYFELAAPATTGITPSQITLQNGSNVLLQTAGSVNRTRLSLGYRGTSYNLPLTKNAKYIKRIDGVDTYVSQGSSNGTLAVIGGRDKLFNLTRWFGTGHEPASVDDFYKLYPAFKYADVPYAIGSLVNFKGATIRTVGFNAYNHATGTARLIGGNEYQVCGTYTAMSYVDQWGNAEELRISSEGIFTPSNDGVLTVTGGNGTDTCVHLTWSGYKNFGKPEYKWEPYIENNKDLPIQMYFPDGMNAVYDTTGNLIGYDELTANQAIKRFVLVDMGTLTWGDYIYTAGSSTYPWGYAVCSELRDIKKGGLLNFICSAYPSIDEFKIRDHAVLGTPSTGTLYIVDSSFIGKTGAQIATSLSGVYLVYPLATPVVTPIEPQLNLTYSVNDFGTEEMLPYPDSITPLSTEFHGYIKYSVDFLRLNIHLNEWYNTIKTLVRNEPDYVLKDRTYDTLGAGTAFNLIDRNAQGAGRQFTFDTTGGSEDITDGTAVIKSYQGTTLMQNQLVADTNVNTAQSSEGIVEVADAVEGAAKGLTMYGDSYVKNQLVPSVAQPKDAASSNGVVEVTDAVAGDALALKMVAPRSVVVNQLIQNGDFSDGTNNWIVNGMSMSVSNNKLTTTVTNDTIPSCYAGQENNSLFIIAGHTYIVHGYVTSSIATTHTSFGILTTTIRKNLISLAANVRTSIDIVAVANETNSTTARFACYLNQTESGYANGDTMILEAIQLVDLTQYFNGDRTLIDSITSWDDLVAYDPRFASYVEYNTGTVTGVQPAVVNYGDEYAYGIIMDTTDEDVPCQRVEYRNGTVTTVDSFSSLPAHDWHRCVMDDVANRHVSYYLDPTDSTRKFNGTYKGVTSDGSASVLTGADGDVMVRQDITHWRVTKDYAGEGKHLYLVSDKPFKGSTPHPFFYTSPDGGTLQEQYVGAYRASVCAADGTPLNTTEGAASQNSGTASTRKARSIAGALPWTTVTLDNLRAAAVRNGGTHVNFWFHHYVYLMMMIEYATVNTQAVSAGYSNGKTNNNYWAWRKSGRTNYGNGTGQTLATEGTTDVDNFFSVKINSVTLYRDAANDANGYYAWAPATRTGTPTRYWTESATPANGSTAYSDANGTATAYTTSAYAGTAAASQVIQFQYRGIENPFGEIWEFEDGFQKWQNTEYVRLKNNSNTSELYTRDSAQDGGSSYAWTNDTAGTIWTASAKPADNSAAYSDAAMTTAVGFTVTMSSYKVTAGEFWHTVATNDYTSTDQHNAANPAYYRQEHLWPNSSNYIREIDPVTLLPTRVGNGASGTKWFMDYFYNDKVAGSRVSFVGGFAYSGASVGLGCRYVYIALSISGGNIGGRFSAR